MQTLILGNVDTHLVYKQSKMSIKTTFHLHSYTNTNGESQIYMGVSEPGNRARIPLGIYVKRELWNQKQRRVKDKAPGAAELNLILEQEAAKISKIKIHYRLTEKPLSLNKLLNEYQNNTPSFDFVSFMTYQLKKMPMKKSSRIKHQVQIKKFKEFCPQIAFSDISLETINDYKFFLATKKKNNPNTIISSLKIIKKFLRKAEKYNIPIDFDIDEIKLGTIRGNRTYLNEEEIIKIKDYYFSGFIRDAHKLPLGYFLFSCYTGLRLSDVRKLKRVDLNSNTFSFVSEKTSKPQSMLINNSTRTIIENYEPLFQKWISAQKINEFLKDICKICGIKKHVSFHCARHTFATLFLRKGGKLEELQVLLNHSKIETTMQYVHMVRAEQMDSVFLLDS